MERAGGGQESAGGHPASSSSTAIFVELVWIYVPEVRRGCVYDLNA